MKVRHALKIITRFVVAYESPLNEILDFQKQCLHGRFLSDDVKQIFPDVNLY